MHIDTELKFYPLYHFIVPLQESCGEVNHIDKYVDAVYNDFVSVCPDRLTNTNPSFSYHNVIDIYKVYPELDELKKKGSTDAPFFRNIDITISINKEISGVLESDINGEYNPEDSHYEGNGEGTVVISERIFCNSIERAKMLIDKNLHHEFIHALFDYNERLNGSSMVDVITRDNYNEFADRLFSGKWELPEDYSVLYLLYYLYDHEMNAFIGGLSSEIKNGINKPKLFFDQKDIMEVICSTSIYKRYESCADCVKMLEMIYDPEDKIRLVSYINNLFGDKSKRYFKTYGEMIKYFKRQLSKFYNKIMKHGPKLAYKYLIKSSNRIDIPHSCFEYLNKMMKKYTNK